MWVWKNPLNGHELWTNHFGEIRNLVEIDIMYEGWGYDMIPPMMVDDYQICAEEYGTSFDPYGFNTQATTDNMDHPK